MKLKLNKKIDINTIEFLKHAKNYISVGLFTKGLAVLTIPVLTRLLSTQEYGILGVYNSIVTVLTILFGFGLRGAITRFYYEKSKNFSSFLFSNLIFWILWSFFLVFLLSLFKGKLHLKLNVPVTIISFSIFISFFSSIFEIFQSYKAAKRESALVSKISALKAITTVTLTLIITYNLLQQRYFGSIYSHFATSLILMFLSLRYLWKDISFNFHLKYILYSLKFSIPVVIHLLSGYALNTFDQIMVNSIIGSHEAGLYSFAYKVGLLIQIVSTGLLKSWTPIFYEKMSENRFAEIEKLAIVFSVIISLSSFSLILFSNELVWLFATENYFSSVSIVPIIIIGLLFNFLYQIYAGYAIYEKKTHTVAIITVFCGLINITLNYYLIPKYGYTAAAWTTLISYFLYFFLHNLNLRLILKIKNVIRLNYIIQPILIVSILTVIYVKLISLTEIYWIQLLSKVVLLSICILVLFYLKKRTSHIIRDINQDTNEVL